MAAMVSAHLAGNVLAGEPPRQNWGKFEAHKWGGFTARPQLAQPVTRSAVGRQLAMPCGNVVKAVAAFLVRNRDSGETALSLGIILLYNFYRN